MSIRLKPLAEQVIVITGASSGHGLSAARKAAATGARVMLVARDSDALQAVVQGIRAGGGDADYVAADVSVEGDIDRVVISTIHRFGGFDTWVNNAGVGTYAKALEQPTEDHRRVFETNYWGMVHGSLAAVRHLKDRPGGGALINVGSVNSDMSSPLLSSYNASKHAMKGFTDSLRIEVLMDALPVSVALLKPSPIGTPFTGHARNRTGKRARLPRPIYAPEIVADAILDAACHPRRSLTVGGSGKLQTIGAALFPTLFDHIAVRMAGALVERAEPVGQVAGNLDAPQGDDGRVDGAQRGRRFSLFATARRHELATAAAVVGAGILARAALTRWKRRA
ncbi:SDR family oxidoreductase [Sphingomonas sp.]|uniref:SDR family oxidoreductase n=1 Tax=Sphingomonas sp. TaxID=28214 RepID=UPI003B3A3845